MYDQLGVQVHVGDCLTVLAGFPDGSVDSVVTDPPAGIGFMGRGWDSARGGRDRWVAWLTERLVEAHRVLKPGGHALVWALPRTSHWTALALDDAGFEIRDCVTHLFGTGFPKSRDVGKDLDRLAGAERVVIRPCSYELRNDGGYSGGLNTTKPRSESCEITAPATDAARRWNGWGTALKPAAEMWWLARKPLAAGSVASNVLAYGTAALNIDACRVGMRDVRKLNRAGGIGYGGSDPQGLVDDGGMGRWPSNVVFTHQPLLDDAGELVGDACADGCVDGCPVAELDRQSGACRSSGTYDKGGRYVGPKIGGASIPLHGLAGPQYTDSGGASRFFPTFRYQAKAPPSERPRVDGKAHPTVKALGLMRWLVRLVTPPGGTVLDLFCGTGATGQAARAEGFRAVLIDDDPQSVEWTVARLRGGVAASLL